MPPPFEGELLLLLLPADKDKDERVRGASIGDEGEEAGEQE